ncbi:MAG: T9SS type A sorting domain-containing protein [Bacteroidetes bacterium]|nr:T9SS type A sorting domain-containing protein [Bacteroidota bacterium]
MKNQVHKLVCLAICAATIIFANKALAITTYTSKVTSGNWSSAGSWNVTGSGSDVKYVIQAGHTISMNVNVSGVDTVSIYGTLDMGSNRTITIDSFGTILVNSGGTLSGGSNNTKIIFLGSPYQIVGPFTTLLGNLITNGPRYATALTTTAASGDPQGSFVGLSLLPVELSSIEVVKMATAYQLQWTALGESNKSTFGIEISTNGTDYYFAGSVSGNEEITSGDYTFNIIGVKGSFYVRLNETDVNGNSKALATKYVKNNTTADAFQIYPTLIAPAGQNIQMVLPTSGMYKVVVYNLNMQVAAESTASTYSSNEAVSFNSSDWNLNAGQYVVVVQGNNGEVYKTRIMVR